MLRRWNRRVEIQFHLELSTGRLMLTSSDHLCWRAEFLEAVAPMIRREMKANGRTYLRLRIQSDQQGIDRAGRGWVVAALITIAALLAGFSLWWIR